MKSDKVFRYSPDGLVVVDVALGDELDTNGVSAYERLFGAEPDKEPPAPKNKAKTVPHNKSK